MVTTLSIVRKLRNQSLDLLLGWLETEGAQCDAQVLQRDVAVCIIVEKAEGLLDIKLLLLGKLLAELAAVLLARGSGTHLNGLVGETGHVNLVVLVLWEVVRLSILKVTKLGSF